MQLLTIWDFFLKSGSTESSFFCRYKRERIDLVISNALTPPCHLQRSKYLKITNLGVKFYLRNVSCGIEKVISLNLSYGQIQWMPILLIHFIKSTCPHSSCHFILSAQGKLLNYIYYTYNYLKMIFINFLHDIEHKHIILIYFPQCKMIQLYHPFLKAWFCICF